MKAWLAVVFLALAPYCSAADVIVTPLTASDVPALVAPPAHGTRIVMLWSLDCVYCEPNMQALATLQRAHPQMIEFLTVATDPIRARTRVTARLAAADIAAYPAYAYAEAAPQRLNFLIDPTWGGELPRTLVIHADGRREGISGLLTPAQLTRITPAARQP